MNLDYDYLIAFQDTPVYTISKESFQFNFFSDKWIVEEHTLIDGLYNPFSVKRIASILEHQELVIKFKPINVCQKNVCYYVIKCSGEKDIVLRVTGKGEGARVQMSLKHIDFYRLEKSRKTKSVFQLQNNSSFTVMFQYDIDNEQKIFKILPLSGTVKPYKTILITATFETEKAGIFMLDVPCLLPFNRPIYLQLFGVNSPTIDLQMFEIYKASYLAPRLVFGFEQYFHSHHSRYNHMCSLTQKYFSFSSESNKTSTFVEVFNHTDECLRIIWDTENEKNFVIHPAIINLRPKERRPFECKFEPQNKEMLMGGHIYGRAQIYDLEANVKKEMIFLRLRLIGNSFVEGKIWNPNLVIPSVVQLPICYVNNSVYTTFVIKRSGPYPATYCFIPPPTTYCEVKPKVGIIKNDFQIFVVQFHPIHCYNSIYSEDWKIELNGRPEYLTSITFKSFIPEAKVLVGDNFTVDFGCVFPGGNKSLDIPVSNICATPLKVKFYERNKWFSVEDPEKIIDCFESTNFVFNYKADVDVPLKSELKFQLYVMHEMGVIDGNALIFHVTILASCAYGQLTSVPSYHNFKDVVCGEEHITKFQIYNFGTSTLNFALKCYKHFGSAEEDPFVINPTRGCLKPEDHLEITVKLCSYENCLGTYCIRYHLLMSENLDELLEDFSEYKTNALLFKMDYYMYYPTLRIVDIGKNQTGALYGKKQIWDFFQVDKLNNILRTITVNQTRQIWVRVPDAQAGRNISKAITFILKNIGAKDTTCHLERKKICDCKLQQVEGTFTFRKYSFNCPHKNILKVWLVDEQIKAFETTFLEVQIFYDMDKTQNMCYLMRLSHNRTIEINFKIKSVELGELSTYVYGFQIMLKHVSIRELTPSVQIYKVSNNTNKNSSYYLTEEPIKELNKKAGYPVLICLNPTAQVNAKSCEGLMFVFAPISLAKISVDVPIQLGSVNYVLHIEGEGTIACKPLLEVSELYAPYKEYYQYPFLLAHISTENITIRALSTFSKVTRIFTLRNVCKDKTLAFWFASTHLEGMIHCAVIPSTGLLMPGCCITLVLTVTSFSMPCYCRAFCSLHLIDQTALSRHFKSNMEFNEEANTTNDFFTITDNKTTYYTKPKAQIEPAPKVFHRNITVTCNIIASSEIELKVPLRERLKMQPCQELPLNEPCLENIKSNEVHEKVDLIEYDTITTCTSDIFDDAFVMNETDDLFDEDICVPAKCCSPSSDCQISSVNIITETVIRDVLDSKKFQYKLTSYLSSEPELYYKDFSKQNRYPETDQKMMQLALNRIPDSILSETMQVLIGNALMHHFKLGTYPDMDLELDHKDQSSTNVSKKLYSEKFAFVLDSC